MMRPGIWAWPCETALQSSLHSPPCCRRGRRPSHSPMRPSPTRPPPRRPPPRSASRRLPPPALEALLSASVVVMCCHSSPRRWPSLAWRAPTGVGGPWAFPRLCPPGQPRRSSSPCRRREPRGPARSSCAGLRREAQRRPSTTAPQVRPSAPPWCASARTGCSFPRPRAGRACRCASSAGSHARRLWSCRGRRCRAAG